MTYKNKSIAVTVVAIAAVAGILASTAIIMAMQQAEAQTTTFTRRVTGSWVQTSMPHNAVGHSAHQVVNFFNPQEDATYSAKVTFTATKGVDIIAYHDITGQNASGIKTWQVGDKLYAVTTLMTNVTSGTVDFVGSGLLAHSTASDSYSVAYSAYGWANKNVPMMTASMASEQGQQNGQGQGLTK
jgi:hypothetical protein